MKRKDKFYSRIIIPIKVEDNKFVIDKEKLNFAELLKEEMDAYYDDNIKAVKRLLFGDRED